MKELVKGEFHKLFRQSRTYYALAALLIIEGLVLFSAYFQGNNIIDILLENLKQSFFFEGELLNGNLLVYLILNTLWFHLPLILMIVTAGILTGEYTDGTLQTLMLQPISKTKLLLAKYVAAIGFTFLVVLVVALTAFGFSHALFGNGDLIVYLDSLNFFDENEAMKRLGMAFVTGLFSMIFFAVVSLTLAVFFKESTKTWIVAAFFLIFSNLMLKVDLGNNWLNRFSFVKLNDTWQYFFWPDIPWNTVFWNSFLLCAYTILTMGIGVYFFAKKAIG